MKYIKTLFLTIAFLAMNFWATAQDETLYDITVDAGQTLTIPDGIPDNGTYTIGVRNGGEITMNDPLEAVPGETQWVRPCGSITQDNITTCGPDSYDLYYTKSGGGGRHLIIDVQWYIDIDESGVLSTSVGTVSNDTVYLPNGTTSTTVSIDATIDARFGYRSWGQLGSTTNISTTRTATLSANTSYWVAYMDAGSHVSFDTVHVVELPSVWTWQGSTSDWSTPSNWSEGTVPTASDEVTISPTATSPVVTTADAICSTLTIETGATFTLSPDGGLEVKSDLTNNGSLVIQSDDQGTGSLITMGSVTGTDYTVQQYATAQRWWYMSSPVGGATSDVFSIDANNVLYWWNETNTGTHGWNEITSTTSLEMMRGYAYQKTSDGATTVSFQGTVNTGELGSSSDLTAEGPTFTGYNLVGNPYPSGIELGLFDDLEGIETTNMIPSVWFRGDNFFAAYNWMSGVSQNGAKSVVAPMQGFWVKVDNNYSSGGIVFNDTCRVHPDTSLFKQETEQEVVRLELLQTASQVADEVVIGFWPQAQQGIDAYDSPKYYANRYAEISALVDGQAMAIAGYTTPQPVNLQIYTEIDEQCELSINEVGFPVFLEDKKTGSFIDLTKQSYPFVYDGPDRFVLHFQDATGVNSPKASSMHIYPNPASEYIYIQIDAEIQSVEILTLAGSTVKEINNPGNRIALDISPGMYIVQATTVDNKILMSKLLVR